jgi:hypothetical protein
MGIDVDHLAHARGANFNGATFLCLRQSVLPRNSEETMKLLTGTRATNWRRQKQTMRTYKMQRTSYVNKELIVPSDTAC